MVDRGLIHGPLDWLPVEWFNQPVEDAARALIGRVLEVDAVDGDARRGVLSEVEAYGDASDLASHYAFRPGGSAAVMAGPPGIVYVYKSHGVHPCFNIVCGPAGTAGAVLVRGVLLLPDLIPVSGPGRTTRALDISTADHGVALNAGRIRVSQQQVDMRIEQTGRINVPRAPETPWRFLGHLPPLPPPTQGDVPIR